MSAPQTDSSATGLEECLICFDEYGVTDTIWKFLECSHKVCVTCYKSIEIKRTTMSGVCHTFVKCPFCLGCTGVEIGTCPNGTMKVNVISAPCEGYEQYRTISILYSICDGEYSLFRQVYLPDNDEGKEVLELLRIAWDRRLCFVIGNSITTGRENTVVWNIHHKTSQRGGSYRYGFPDPTYFQRVKLELMSYGIYCKQ